MVRLFNVTNPPRGRTSHHAQHVAGQHGAPASGDSSFASLESWCPVGMGVDQYTSAHTFESHPDRGRITLQRDVDDTTGVETIRAHMRTIGDWFAGGKFDIPGFLRAKRVPGTDVMAARRGACDYRPGATGGCARHAVNAN